MLLWHFCSRFKFRGCFTILSLSYYSFSTVGYSNLGFLKFCAVILIINLCYTDPFGSFFFTFLSQPHLMQYQYITHFLIPRLIFLLVQRRHNGFFCFFFVVAFFVLFATWWSWSFHHVFEFLYSFISTEILSTKPHIQCSATSSSVCWTSDSCCLMSLY